MRFVAVAGSMADSAALDRDPLFPRASLAIAVTDTGCECSALIRQRWHRIGYYPFGIPLLARMEPPLGLSPHGPQLSQPGPPTRFGRPARKVCQGIKAIFGGFVAFFQVWEIPRQRAVFVLDSKFGVKGGKGTTAFGEVKMPVEVGSDLKFSLNPLG
jgi:hypothetical protein